MVWVDYCILGVIGFSLLIGIFRGFIKEMLALMTWGVAIWVGMEFCRPFATLLENQIPQPSVRIAAAFGILLFTTLVLGALVGFLLGVLVKKTGLTGTDRFVGLFFGVARGVLVVSVLVLLADFTPLPEDPWWKQSRLLPYFHKTALWLKDYIPGDMLGRILDKG